jgi:hypothetical protein
MAGAACHIHHREPSRTLARHVLKDVRHLVCVVRDPHEGILESFLDELFENGGRVQSKGVAFRIAIGDLLIVIERAVRRRICNVID